jgi:hypothetical protein
MGPIIRIALRYLAGALVTYGLVPADIAQELANDPDVIGVVLDGVNWLAVAGGTGLAAAIEWAYRLAKKHGWAT